MKIKLYKRNTTGSIQEWEIEAVADSYRTHSGQVGGKIVTSKWTQCEAKNVGRANATTAAEQAILTAERKAERQREKGYRDSIEDVDKGHTFKPMLANKVKDVNDLPFPVWSQSKLDGVRCICKKDGMWTRNGKPILSAPHIHDQLEATDIWDKYPDAVLDGELYNHELRDKFEQIISLARKSKPTAEDLEASFDMIQYHIYDMVIRPGDDKLGWWERNLRTELALPPSCKWVRTQLVDNVEQLNELYGEYLEKGFEGQMIRIQNCPYEQKRSRGLLKRKEFIDEEFEIIDVIEGQGNRSGMAGRIRCRMSNGNEFQAGIKGGEALYVKMLQDRGELIGKRATIRYQNLSDYGIPRFPVCVGVRDYE